MADASLGTAVLHTKLDVTGLKTGLDTARQETEKFGRDGVTAVKGIGTALGAVGASKGLRAYVGFMRDSAVLSHQATASAALFQKALERNNQSAAEGAAVVQRLADKFGVVNSVVEESATFMLRQGASLDDVERALTAAGASAAAAGVDISMAFNNVGVAVATGRSQLLETSGIVANLGPVAQAYAKSVGKTVEQLTQQELIQARVNAIYDETKSEIEDVDILLRGLPRSQAEVTRQWRSFRETAGDLALKVIVPLTEGLGTMLRFVNSLPTPVKNVGIAMTGAAIGATALATGFIAIKTALTGLSGLGLLSFGPAGWIVLGVTAVAGLAAALATGGDSLTTALDTTRKAVASGNKDSMTGALDELVKQVDGPVKTSLQGLRDELVATGDVGVEQAKRILTDVALAVLDAKRQVLGVSLFGPTPLGGALAQAAGLMGNVNLASDIRKALDDNDLLKAIDLLQDAIVAMTEAGLKPAYSQPIVDFLAQVGAIPNFKFTPTPDATTPPGEPGKPSDIQRRMTSLRTELAALQREVDVGLADAATLAERQGSVVDSAIRDLIRLGASDNLLNTLLGEASEFKAAVRERAVLIAPILRAELMDERLRAERAEIDRLSSEANRRATIAQQKAQSDRLAAIARAPIIRAVAWDDAWFDERQEIEDLAIRAHNEARIAQQKRESERLAAIARAPLIRAAAWDDAWFREMEETEALQAELAAARIVRENRNQAAIRAIMAAYNRGAPGGSLYDQNAAYLDRETQRQAERMRGMDITTTNTDRAIIAERELAMQRLEAAKAAGAALEAFARSEAQRAQELRYGTFGERYTEQLAVQDRARRGYQFGLQKDLGTQLAEYQLRLGVGMRDAFRQRQGLGVPPWQEGGIMRRSDWEAQQRSQEQAADRFANTVVSAGFAFGDAAIKAFQDGDVVGIIRSGLSGAGSILGGADLGSIGFLGGSIGIGGLVAGGLGLLGTLIGALAGGGSRDAEERRRREQQQARSVPAININFSVTQHNQYNGAPSDPKNEQAFARQADSLFESIYRRHLGPRLDRIEQRLGIAGA